MKRPTLFIFILLVFYSPFCFAQLTKPMMNRNGLNNELGPDGRPLDPFATDTSKKDEPTDWDETPAKIYYTYNNSLVKHTYDSSVLFFHRNKYIQPNWNKDLGNWGSAAKNLIFTPVTTTGPRLEYTAWDMYRFRLDSIPFINTTRPYTSFSYMLGSKQMQWVEILHTQNITPTWNFAIKLSNNSSQGYFKYQKVSALNGYLSSNYSSKDKRYISAMALIFNNFKQDENGGIQNDSFLTSSLFDNSRENIPTIIGQNSFTTGSPVQNRQKELSFYWQNSYAWGKSDSLYNKDSTDVTYRFIPRFSLKHSITIQQMRHYFSDNQPDSLQYLFYGPLHFQNIGDTVRNIQKWFLVDNKFSLNTFLGKDSQQIKIEAGVGIRFDRFKTDYFTGNDVSDKPMSNYVFGQISKEAIKSNQWSYSADARFFVTGKAAGNLNLKGTIQKDFKNLGSVAISAAQDIINPAYNYEYFRTSFFTISNNDLGKTSITTLSGQLNIAAIKLQAGIRNHVVGNYIYYDQNLKVQQAGTPFSVLEIFGRKLFSFGAFSLDNEVVWQQTTANAPVHIPSIMLRHQLAARLPLFKGKLESYFGIEGRYSTDYFADGYAPILNQFYYQSDYKVKNKPELAAFFNFRVKRLRAFIIGDQLQQFFWKRNVINFPGYPAPNAHFRFGFNWVMMN